MSFVLSGGTGNGYAAKVSQYNKLEVHSVNISEEHWVNHDRGYAFQIPFNQSPTAAGDCIFYLENTSTERDLIIEGVCIGVANCTADDTVYFEYNDAGTRNSGTTVTPANVNTGSNKVAEATCEKGADLDGGASTLTTGTEIFRIVLPGITDMAHKFFNFEMDLVLVYGKAFTIWVGGSATGTYYCNLPIYFTAADD